MKKRALIFAGAGASFAVNKDAYPTTVQFFDRLPSTLREHRLINAIVSNLPQKFGDGRPDVEKILWCLTELGEFLKRIDEPTHPASWFVATNSLPGLVGGHDIASFTATARQAISVINDLSGQISAKVYDYYSSPPAQDSVRDNWQELFNILAVKGYSPDIVTTNYDLVIEHAAEFAGQPIEFGKGRGVVSALDLSLWKRQLSGESELPDNGLLTKLHGSLNWLREGDRIIFGGTEFKGNHSYHGVIYPGFKGVPQDEPFSLMHSYLEASIQRADVVIFIGFAFRDEYINTCLERNVGSKLIHVIDPAQPAVTPALKDQIRHVAHGFDASAMDELRNMI